MKYQFKTTILTHIIWKNALDPTVSPETEFLNASPSKIEHKKAYKHLKIPSDQGCAHLLYVPNISLGIP